MNYNFEELFEAILSAVNSKEGICERMHHVIDVCEKQCPHPDWNLYRKVGFEEDQPALDQWLLAILPEPSDLPVRGLWFGIGNYYCEGGTETTDIYARSSRSYDLEPESTAWVRDDALGDNLLNSAILCQIHDIAFGREHCLGNNAEYPLALTYGAIVAAEAIRKLRFTKYLQHLAGAVAGFDDGDGIVLGRLIDGRFSFDAQLR
jgi:hypothetical protein